MERNEKIVWPWCWYCNREFEDKHSLIVHQKAKHFKCKFCSKKFHSVPDLRIHCKQDHKKTLDKVPKSIHSRNNMDFKIHGMQGIPEKDLIPHIERLSYYGELDDDEEFSPEAKNIQNTESLPNMIEPRSSTPQLPVPPMATTPNMMPRMGGMCLGPSLPGHSKQMNKGSSPGLLPSRMHMEPTGNADVSVSNSQPNLSPVGGPNLNAHHGNNINSSENSFQVEDEIKQVEKTKDGTKLMHPIQDLSLEEFRAVCYKNYDKHKNANVTANTMNEYAMLQQMRWMHYNGMGMQMHSGSNAGMAFPFVVQRPMYLQGCLNIGQEAPRPL
ncbi:hypothetical protein JTE90_017850 [Oedothorax gibbosus]|uniref:C2H2-type domain-containing protein n=1 Tax=Oedothorax gibbosus TaxID=931172 RepID=A0AAV6TQT0_9ARAC|nr:hypothetical protein JTE90_017850 [Oedothorax gibbosus]